MAVGKGKIGPPIEKECRWVNQPILWQAPQPGVLGQHVFYLGLGKLFFCLVWLIFVLLVVCLFLVFVLRERKSSWMGYSKVGRIWRSWERGTIGQNIMYEN